MKKPQSPCQGCEVRLVKCHEYCDLYKDYVERMAEYRRKVKAARWAAYGNTVEWSEGRLKKIRGSK